LLKKILTIIEIILLLSSFEDSGGPNTYWGVLPISLGPFLVFAFSTLVLAARDDL
jgi:hypothetical protein